MLRFSRRKDQKVYLTTPNGETIVLNIEQIRRETVVVTIEAPHSIGIVRGELLGE